MTKITSEVGIIIIHEGGELQQIPMSNIGRLLVIMEELNWHNLKVIDKNNNLIALVDNIDEKELEKCLDNFRLWCIK